MLTTCPSALGSKKHRLLSPLESRAGRSKHKPMDGIATTQKVRQVGGVATELCIMEFADRFFVVLTQLNKPGTLVRRPMILPLRCSVSGPRCLAGA